MRQSEARWPFALAVIALNIGALWLPKEYFTTELMWVVMFLSLIITIAVVGSLVVHSFRQTGPYRKPDGR